ncbi:hypothetical protein GC170_15495 [bacterium]|nr:hypothetical protein [bacterium]
MPNFGIALEFTDANGKPARRGQFVEISPEATIVESNGNTVESPDSGPISRTFPNFEERFPGAKAVYFNRSADSDTPFAKLNGKLLITPGRNLEVHFKGTRPQTRKDDGAAFSLKSAKQTGQGYQVVVEYPPTTLMKSAGNAFEMMQALTTIPDIYGLTLVDSEGDEHQPVSRSSGAAAGSSFRSVTVNGVTRSESTNSPANSMTTVTYGFAALPENVRVESLVATAIDRQGKPKVVPFMIEIDSK